MKGQLNIYACTGLADRAAKIGEIDDVGRYHYWLNGTQEWTNTRAYNFLLAQANGKMYEISYIAADEATIAERMNELDIYIVCLEALDFVGQNDLDALRRAGSIIGAMCSAQLFKSSFIDDNQRATNLDGLIQNFKDAYNEGATYTDSEFTQWWEQHILSNTFNLMTEEEKARCAAIFTTEKISGTDEDDNQKTFSEYIENAGDYFLYIFIPEADIRKYNSAIQKRYKKEQEIYRWCCDNCNGMYTEATVLRMIRNGVTVSKKMTPETAIKKLNEAGKGKVGIATEIIVAIVGAVATVLAALLSLITQVVTIKLAAKYSKPADEDSGIPQSEDWELNNKEKDNTTLLLIGGGLAAYFLLTKD